MIRWILNRIELTGQVFRFHTLCQYSLSQPQRQRWEANVHCHLPGLLFRMFQTESHTSWWTLACLLSDCLSNRHLRKDGNDTDRLRPSRSYLPGYSKSKKKERRFEQSLRKSALPRSRPSNLCFRKYFTADSANFSMVFSDLTIPEQSIRCRPLRKFLGDLTSKIFHAHILKAKEVRWRTRRVNDATHPTTHSQ